MMKIKSQYIKNFHGRLTDSEKPGISSTITSGELNRKLPAVNEVSSGQTVSDKSESIVTVEGEEDVEYVKIDVPDHKMGNFNKND